MNAKVIIRDNVSRSGNFKLHTDTLENNVLGFQRTYLSILHTAIESRLMSISYLSKLMIIILIILIPSL